MDRWANKFGPANNRPIASGLQDSALWSIERFMFKGGWLVFEGWRRPDQITEGLKSSSMAAMQAKHQNSGSRSSRRSGGGSRPIDRSNQGRCFRSFIAGRTVQVARSTEGRAGAKQGSSPCGCQVSSLQNRLSSTFLGCRRGAGRRSPYCLLGQGSSVGLFACAGA